MPVLAGITQVIAGQGATETEVVLSRPVHFPGGECYDSPSVRVQGSAQVVDVELISIPFRFFDNNYAWGHIYNFGRFPPSDGGGTFTDTECTPTTVAAGTYRLVIVHTPGTASVTLTLPGLTGHAVIRPTEPSRAVVQVLPAILPPDVATATASQEYGNYQNLTGPGVVELAGLVIDRIPGDPTSGSCGAPGAPSLPPAVAFSRACTGPGSFGFIGASGAGAEILLGGYYEASPGICSDGFYYYGAPLRLTAVAVGAWIPLQ
ncbi:MAG: hypothetical protein ACYDAQ_01360 [Mycobacteriales bacterium]